MNKTMFKPARWVVSVLAVVLIAELAGCSAESFATRENSAGNDGSPSITSVTVNPATAAVEKGGTKRFGITVLGANWPPISVTWTVEEADRHADTRIDNYGVLTVAAEEALDVLTIRATSTLDTTKYGTATVTLYEPGQAPTVTRVIVSSVSTTVEKGTTQTFTATVIGENNPAQTVTWTIEQANKNANTTMSAAGLLAVAAGEALETLTVRATSTLDTTKYGTATVLLSGGTSPLGIEMVSIPGGSFTMGSPDGTPDSEPNERPTHTVTLSSFRMGKYEVTQGQWHEVMKDPGNPGATGVGTGRPSQFTANQDDTSLDGWRTLPVERVNWYEAVVFCNKLSVRENLTPVYSKNDASGDKTDPANWGSIPTADGAAADNWNSNIMPDWGANGYRLPTEAEWEYAAKGGDGSPGGYAYSGSNTVGDVAWYGGNAGSKTHQVGEKDANGLGLYDMTGNVYEWCWDWYASSYQAEVQNNPHGPVSGSNRAVRGGSWSLTPSLPRSARRGHLSPWRREGFSGFRLVRGGA